MSHADIVSLCDEYMQQERCKELGGDIRARMAFYDGMQKGLMIAASLTNEQRLDQGKKVQP